MNKNAISRATDFIDYWLDHRFNDLRVPGIGLTASYKGKVFYHKSLGFADIENKIPLQADSVFRIASHSKTFTSVAIFQLQEQGKLKLDDKLSKYLPWLNQHQDDRFKNLTIKQVLSHTAGIIRDGLDSDFWSLERPFPNKDQLKQAVLGSNLYYSAGRKLKYSNIGYSLLGWVIESVTQSSYSDYLTKHIINPLGLKNTYTENSRSKCNKLVVGYSNFELGKRLSIDNSPTNALEAATGLYSNGTDLCKFYAALETSSKLLLNNESKRQLAQPQIKALGTKEKTEYSFGLIINQRKNCRLIGHSGGFPGHSTATFSNYANHLTISVLVNSISLERDLCAPVHQIFSFFLKNYSENNPLNRFSGRYSNLWSTTEFIPAKNKIVAVDPKNLTPFDDPEVLKPLGPDKLTIFKTDSFSPIGETVKFNFKNNQVISVNYASSTIYPNDVWEKIINKSTKFKLKEK